MGFAALLTPPVPLVFATGAVGAVFALWCLRFPHLALGFLLGSLAVGQLVRLPLLGQSGGLLLSDLAVGLVVLVAVVHSRWPHPHSRPAWVLVLLVTPFMLWSLWGLAMHTTEVAWSELQIAAAYWLRLNLYLVLLPAVLVLVRGRVRANTLMFSAMLVLLALLGVAQWWLVPDLTILGGGWDPHQGRLVSTWLDPNLMGGLFAVALPWFVGIALSVGWFKKQPAYTAVVMALLIAVLLLTKSRSSLVALALSLLFLSPLIMAWMVRGHLVTQRLCALAIASMAALIFVVAVALLGERAWGALLVDPTVAARLTALREVAHLAADHALVGVGYNLYQFAARDAGLITDFSLHSRAGSDNSLLTLWVTTGIVGVLLFLLPWVAVGHLMRRAAPAAHPVAVGTLCALLTWLLHSQFVNSLLYAHLLAAVAYMAALSLALVIEPKRV